MKKLTINFGYILPVIYILGCNEREIASEPTSETSPPSVQLTQLGDSIRFEHDSLYQWIVDFKFRSDTAYILANQSNVNEYYVGTGGFFLFSEGGREYKKVNLPGIPDRFISIDTLRNENYVLKFNSICRLMPALDSCETMPIDGSYGSPREFRKLFATTIQKYMVVGNSNGVIDQRYKLIEFNDWRSMSVKVPGFEQFDFTGDKFYWLTIQGMYSVPWNDIGSVEIKRSTMQLSADTSWDGMGQITKFKVIDGIIFQYGLGLPRSTYPYYAFAAKRAEDSTWKMVAVDSGTKFGESHPREERFLDFSLNYSFADAGNFVVYFDRRFLWVFRKSDLKVRKFSVKTKIIGSKWDLVDDKLYTNGFSSLYYINIRDLESLFENIR